VNSKTIKKPKAEKDKKVDQKPLFADMAGDMSGYNRDTSESPSRSKDTSQLRHSNFSYV
jgi:hypothetical protein